MWSSMRSSTCRMPGSTPGSGVRVSEARTTTRTSFTEQEVASLESEGAPDGRAARPSHDRRNRWPWLVGPILLVAGALAIVAGTALVGAGTPMFWRVALVIAGLVTIDRGVRRLGRAI